MASLLALFSSILWGSADFYGGKLAKRYPSIAVTGLSQSMGLLFGIIAIVLTSSFHAPDLSWRSYFLPGIVAGISGLLKAYRGVHEVITTIMLNSIVMALRLLPPFSFAVGFRPIERICRNHEALKLVTIFIWYRSIGY